MINFKLKYGRESDQHLLLKTAAAAMLKERGYEIKFEEITTDNHRVDVLAIGHEKKIVVECETLLELRERLTTSFRKALLKFGPFDSILCLPKFIKLSEIWMVDDSGKLVRFLPIEGELNDRAD